MQWGVRAPLEVFKTVNKGWGVRATKTIEPEEYICTYAGEVRCGAVRCGCPGFLVLRKAIFMSGMPFDVTHPSFQERYLCFSFTI